MGQVWGGAPATWRLLWLASNAAGVLNLVQPVPSSTPWLKHYFIPSYGRLHCLPSTCALAPRQHTITVMYSLITPSPTHAGIFPRPPPMPLRHHHCRKQGAGAAAAACIHDVGGRRDDC